MCTTWFWQLATVQPRAFIAPDYGLSWNQVPVVPRQGDYCRPTLKRLHVFNVKPYPPIVADWLWRVQ